MLPRSYRYTALALVGLAALPVQSQELERQRLTPWYFGIKAATVFTESDRPASNGKLLGATLGRHLSPSSAVEWELYHSTTEFDAGYDVDQNAFKMNYVLTNPAPLWRPYVLVGFGVFRYKLPGDNDTGLTVAVATGAQWDLGSNGTTLRAELRYRYSDAESELPDLFKKGEPIFSLGVDFPLSW
jgi:hypothetical protein